jgi:hypothetical protein
MVVIIIIGAQLGTVQVTSVPSQVSEVAELQTLITPITTIPINGKIKITVPSSTSITTGTLA